MLDWLVDPFQQAFMLRALAAVVIVGTVVPVLGCYIVLRGMAFFGDALAHIVLPGVVLAFLLDLPLAVGALVVGIVAALAIGEISQRAAIREDTAIGVVFAGAFALGVALLSARGNYAVDLAHLLFGNLLAVGAGDLWLMAGLSLVVLLLLIAFYKELLVLSFDRVLAQTLQLPVRTLQNLLLVLLAVVIVIGLQTVGVALMLAQLVTPAATAYLLTRRLPPMMMLAALIGVVSGIGGLLLSYYLDVASGPAIVLVETLAFLAVFLLSGDRSRRMRQRARRRHIHSH